MAGQSISKRVFGADMPEGCKRKMTVRQALARDSQPGDSITFIKADGTEEEITDFYEEMGGARGVNFQAGEKGVLGDLSSRTSFARLWCGLQVQKIVPDGEFEAKDFAKDGDSAPKEVEEPGFIYRKEGDKVKKFKTEKYEQIVYEIGNNVLNSEPVNPNMPIIDEPTGDKVGDGFEFAQQFKTNENEYFKPQSGIMDVDSKTKDSMGLIKETTINFMVHNYHDYDKIYSRFFLRPGAQLVCDFGWDTADLYDPKELIEKISKGDSMENILYGDDGHITNSNGDMDTVIGLVTTFDSSIESNGSVKCSVTITSKNAALLQRDFDGEASRLRERMISQLDTKVLGYAAEVFKGMEVLDPDGTYSANEGDWKKILNAFAAENLGNNAFIPTEKGNIPGVYWHTIDGENPSDGKNIYLMWGVFEDRILNHDIGYGLDLNDILFGENFSTRFDSSNTYMRYDKNLYDRQSVTKNASGIDFLYPEKWDNTYNTIIGKRPNPADPSTGWPYTTAGGSDITPDKEKEMGWIPVRDVYFSLNMLKESLKSSNNMKQVMESICKRINENSGGVVDLKLGSNDHASNTVSLIDRKFTPGAEDSEQADFFDKLFIFKPHSPNSFIKSFDLNLKSPSGKMASMYAIQAMAPGMQMFPISDAVDAQLGMKILNDHNEEGGKQETGVTFLPDQGVHRAEQIQRDEDKGANASAEYDDTAEERDPFANEMVTANELLNKETPALEKGPKLTKAKAEAEEDMKKRKEAQKEGKPSKGSSDDAEYNEGHPSSIKLVTSAKEYYETKATSQFRSKKSSPLLPMENGFEVYGIGTINAGDLYRIDLLPERYRDKMYFQITGVQHTINSSGWGTKVDGIPRFRLKAKQDAEIHVYPDIFVSRNALSKLDGFEEELKYFISELQPIAERPSNPTNIDEIWMFKSRQAGSINHTKEEFLKAGDDGKTDDFKKAETNIKKVKGVKTTTSGDSVSYTQKFSIKKDTEYKIVVGGSDWFIFEGSEGMAKFKPLGDAFKMRRNVNA